MTLKKQRKAFDLELHALVTRYMSEFDLPAEELLDLLMGEEMFLIWACLMHLEEDEGQDEDYVDSED